MDDREAFGHWEMDTVIGTKKSQKALLVLTERKTRLEIIEPLETRTSDGTIKALDRIERSFGEKKFREIFKTITVDNGPEFVDYMGMEKSRRNRFKKRTKIYYCHAYASYERGSNENQNKLIRRFIPKYTDFDHKPRSELKKIESWMNTYPRRLFGYMTSMEVFDAELKKLYP